MRLVKPPPRSMVWLACFDCKKAGTANHASMVTYAPSSAPLPTPDGSQVVGHFTTLAIGFAAFQVFSVDFVEAEHRKAVVWNSRAPASIAQAAPRRIWPQLLGAGDVVWPPHAFPNDSFGRLANWDMKLRRP